MKKMSVRHILKAINSFVIFFLTVAFAVSCCMMLFVSTLADSMGLVFTPENISNAAKITFGNVPQIASSSWTPSGRKMGSILATVLVEASDSTKIVAAAAAQAAQTTSRNASKSSSGVQ